MTKLSILCFAILGYSAALGHTLQPKVSRETSGRIVGGQDAEEGQFPWQVSIRRSETGNHNCGGSILNSKWILTAGHCIYSTSESDWYIVVGTVSLSSGGTTHQISRIILHDDYVHFLYTNDVAVIEVEDEIQFSPRVQPIELDPSVIGQVDCAVSGWGFLEAEGETPDRLQFLLTRTLTHQQCLNYWTSILLHPEQMCSYTRTGEGVCNGDSGSAIVANGRQIGLVSWGRACAVGFPDVNARISVQYDWIRSAIES